MSANISSTINIPSKPYSVIITQYAAEDGHALDKFIVELIVDLASQYVVSIIRKSIDCYVGPSSDPEQEYQRVSIVSLTDSNPTTILSVSPNVVDVRTNPNTNKVISTRNVGLILKLRVGDVVTPIHNVVVNSPNISYTVDSGNLMVTFSLVSGTYMENTEVISITASDENNNTDSTTISFIPIPAHEGRT